jgi:tRNA threonylcarbamoyladenosine modification (KEOPS) complex Cgi121 subunit
MLILRCSSKEKRMHALVASAEALPSECILIRPSAARMERELQFAFYLARGAFGMKNNISSKLSNEAILFLARETNFSSALKKVGASDASDFILVCEKRLPVPAVKKILSLSSAQKIRLPEWGEKKGHYSKAELAIEEMALARIRN